jgi:hypothetical protein
MDQLISLVLIIHNMNHSVLVLLDDALAVKVLNQRLVSLKFLSLLLELGSAGLKLFQLLQFSLNIFLFS